MDWSGVDYCDVYQLSGLSFWRHPFTAADPLLSKWCNATFLQIWWRNKLIYILYGLRVSTFSIQCEPFLLYWDLLTSDCRFDKDKFKHSLRHCWNLFWLIRGDQARAVDARAPPFPLDWYIYIYIYIYTPFCEGLPNLTISKIVLQLIRINPVL